LEEYRMKIAVVGSLNMDMVVTALESREGETITVMICISFREAKAQISGGAGRLRADVNL
jgi:hypothetical protein